MSDDYKYSVIVRSGVFDINRVTKFVYDAEKHEWIAVFEEGEFVIGMTQEEFERRCWPVFLKYNKIRDDRPN